MTLASTRQSIPRLTTAKGAEPKLLATLLALVAATSGSERGLLVPGLKISDLLLVVLAVVALIRWGGRWKLIDGLGFAILVYSLFHVALTVANFSERTDLATSALLAEVLAAPQYLLLYLLAYAIGQKSGTILTWLRPSMIIACAISVLAVLQIADLGPIRDLLAWYTGNERIANPLNWQVYRGSGLFPSWHALGMYLCIHVVIAAACLGKGHFDRRERRLFVWMILLGSVGILTTSTGTPIIIAAVAIIFFTLTPRTAWIVISTAIAAVFAVAFTPLGISLADRLGRQFDGNSGSLVPQSFEFRLSVWRRDFFPIIQANLWDGYGPIDTDNGIFSYTESMYILLLLRGGLPLVVTFAVMLLVAFVVSSRLSHHADSEVRAVARAMRYLAVMLAIFMTIHPYLNDAGGAALFFTAMGIVSGLGYREDLSSLAEEFGQPHTPGLTLRHVAADQGSRLT